MLIVLTDRRNLMSILSQGVGAALGLAAFMLLSRKLTVEGFGSWTLYLTVTTLFELMRSGVFQTPLVRYAAGAMEPAKREIIGSSWVAGIGFTLALIIIFLMVGLFLPAIDRFQIFSHLLKFYPILAFVSLPHSYASWNLQSIQRFSAVLVLRTTISGSFVLFLLSEWEAGYQLEQIISGHIAANAIGSLLALFAGWSQFSAILQARWSTAKQLLRFGQFTGSTAICSNLLRSADILLIGWFLGPAASAIYSIPLRLVEIIEIPLRGFSNAALPLLSALAPNGQNSAFAEAFKNYTRSLTLLVLPVLPICFFFSDKLIELVGGTAYVDASPILLVLAVYMILLPLDRFIGIALDVLKKPHLNFGKVALMVVANIIGDVLVLNFTEALWAIALVTIITTLIGLYLGYRYLSGLLQMNFLEIFSINSYQSTKPLEICRTRQR